MEEPVILKYKNNRLYGIYHIPKDCTAPKVAVIMVVGGAQTRYGSHRLYLQVARFLHDNGIPVLRFDCEGMGDSYGSYQGLMNAEHAIGAALDFVTLRHKNVSPVLWGLCDGSTAAAIFADNNPNMVSGMILCNPFVHTEQEWAKTNMKYYYYRRLKDIDFWIKLITFKINFKKTLKDLKNNLKNANLFQKVKCKQSASIETSLPDLVLGGLSRFGKPVTCILSINDLVAMEFIEAQKKRKTLKGLMKKNKIKNLIIKDADHTFTKIEARTKLYNATLQAIIEIMA